MQIAIVLCMIPFVVVCIKIESEMQCALILCMFPHQMGWSACISQTQK